MPLHHSEGAKCRKKHASDVQKTQLFRAVSAAKFVRHRASGPEYSLIRWINHLASISNTSTKMVFSFFKPIERRIRLRFDYAAKMASGRLARD
jgi:hypothetical protein